MKTFLEIVGIIAAALAFMALLVFVIETLSTWHRAANCEDFCKDRGHDPYYAPTLGCFCDDENGQRYNPEHLVPPGTSISITE